MAGADPLALPFGEAIQYLRDKVRLPTRGWTDLWEGQHARAFVVAGAMRDSLLASLHQAVTRVIAEGRTLDDFRRDFDQIVAREGWSYRGGRNWRTRVIFETNARMAYAAGHWAQMQETKARRPWLRYVAVLDERTRPEHAHWHDTVLDADDLWWKSHYPPNGWNCRCTVQQLSARDLDRLGLKPSAEAPPVELEDRTVRLPDGGTTTVQVPAGIDTGFGYNVGEAAFGRGASAVAMERHGPWEALEAPGWQDRPLPRLPLDRPRAEPGPRVPRGREAALREALRQALGADEVTLTDPAGGRVTVGQALVDHIVEQPDTRWDGRERYFHLIPELIEDPQEILVGFARSTESGRTALRRRYIKALDLGAGNALVLVADQDNGIWSGITVFNRRSGQLDRVRTGLPAWRRPDVE